MKNFEDLLKTVPDQYFELLEKIQTEADLEEFRLAYLSRQGHIALLMAQLKDLPAEEKRVYGPQLNEFKNKAQAAFDQKKEQFFHEKIKKAELRKTSFDVTAYKPGIVKGSLHPYTQVIEEIENIFMSMGFEIADGPEVESDYYNFETLNIPADHPARDMHDTFWLDVPGMLMRTHTSTLEIHTMQTQKPPIAIAAPGRCYRHEATDASHDFMFMQCEGLVVDKNISMSNLFATTKAFLQAVFNKKDLDIRIRPGFFPFVEPGIEIDMSCPFCTSGCSTCKKTRWIEICGAGLTHPNVLRACGIDPDQYSGFAFGFGLTRLVMLKYGIKDIRLLHDGKIDFLKQF